ncbi:hypothetical protein CYMTET_14158 [Cymbomonas tetramitiformis]|uniref:Uncharacterized protein n=1 Tax=Cymbomonas tetramitiformis TaxID=36881 RepID=A0AAE0LAG9_9CHLO|nr:hypothetical protein CYMTET_14158 [Cymbomonas tetramitiformis]
MGGDGIVGPVRARQQQVKEDSFQRGKEIQEAILLEEAALGEEQRHLRLLRTVGEEERLRQMRSEEEDERRKLQGCRSRRLEVRPEPEKEALARARNSDQPDPRPMGAETDARTSPGMLADERLRTLDEEMRKQEMWNEHLRCRPPEERWRGLEEEKLLFEEWYEDRARQAAGGWNTSGSMYPFEGPSYRAIVGSASGFTSEETLRTVHSPESVHPTVPEHLLRVRDLAAAANRFLEATPGTPPAQTGEPPAGTFKIYRPTRPPPKISSLRQQVTSRAGKAAAQPRRSESCGDAANQEEEADGTPTASRLSGTQVLHGADVGAGAVSAMGRRGVSLSDMREMPRAFSDSDSGSESDSDGGPLPDLKEWTASGKPRRGLQVVRREDSNARGAGRVKPGEAYLARRRQAMTGDEGREEGYGQVSADGGLTDNSGDVASTDRREDKAEVRDPLRKGKRRSEVAASVFQSQARNSIQMAAAKDPGRRSPRRDKAGQGKAQTSGATILRDGMQPGENTSPLATNRKAGWTRSPILSVTRELARDARK